MSCLCKIYVLSALAAFSVSEAARSNTGVFDSYDIFRRTFRSEDVADSVDYETRRALFYKRKAEADAHNARQGNLWVAGLNHFSDQTDEERSVHFGYRRSSRRSAPRESSFLEMGPALRPAHLKNKQLAASASWKHLATVNNTRSQGHCGSCWAVSSAGALEMHAELATGSFIEVSEDQLVDCTPNEDHCGGTGGCKGATGELAMAYTKEHGLAVRSGPGEYVSEAGHNNQGACHDKWTPTLQIAGFTRLPENNAASLMEAVSTKGPVVISADATPWMSYLGGIFDGCDKDAIVNHAILLVGYGKDDALGKKYWEIRNSWGKSWGENGMIRLLRHDNDDEYCGTDRDPKAGVACDSDKATEVTVCGMCGMLADSVYPTGVTLNGAAQKKPAAE